MYRKATQWSLVGLMALAMAGSVLAQKVDDRKYPGDKRYGEEEQIEKRKKWFVAQRNLQSVYNPQGIRAAAIEESRLAIESLAGDLRVPGSWSVVGPAPMDMMSWTMGRVAGRVSALAVTPGNENQLYLGTASGGLWKTTDGGTSWSSIFDNVGTQTIGSLALDPNNSNTLWVGTGEQDTACTAYFGLGLFRSTDGGATFEARNGSGSSALNLSYVTAVAVQPGNSNVILAGGAGYCSGGTLTGGGLYRSTDGGATWTNVGSGQINDIIFDPNSPSIVYAAAGSEKSSSTSGVFKSTNGGASFTQLTTGILSGSSAGRTRLAMAPSNSQVLYALMNRSGTTTGLYRTTDAGANWSLRNSNACDGQCTYNLAIDVHPTSSDTVLLGSILHWRSTNGGTNLTVLDNGWGSSQKVHQDTHVVRYSRTNGSRFWVGSDGGLWRTDDGSSTYTNLNNGINITQFYDIAVHPTNARIFGGAQDNSSSTRINSNTWSVVTVTGDGFTNVVDSGNANYVFITSYPDGNYYPSIYRSTSGGGVNGFSYLSTSGISASAASFPWETELTMIQGSTTSYLFTGSSQVFRANARATSWSWTSISGNLASSTVSAFGNQVGGNTLYVGFQNGRIFRSDNALATSPTWTEVTGTIPSGWISDLAVDPANGQRVFVTRSVFGSTKLYRSTNGGGAWTAVGAGLPDVPANAVSVDPLVTTRIFVGTDIGVYVSEDNGDNFVPQMDGMPLGTVVTDLEIDDSPYLLSAGTYGRSAFQLTLTGAPPPPTNVLANGVPVTGLSGAVGSNTYFTLSVPAGATNLKFVTTGGTGDADLYARFGSQPTTTTFDCSSTNGNNEETCSITTASAGTYHVLLYGYTAYSGVSLTGSFTAPGGQTTVTFYAVAAEDGRIWESGETTNVGGGLNSTDNTTASLRVGDFSDDTQYRSVVSFDTSSLPDGATLVSATLRLKRGTLGGTSPFSTHGTCTVDISSAFGGATAIAAGDFEAAAAASGVASMSNPTANGAFSTGALNAAGLSAVSKTGRTQFRVYMTLDDNDDLGSDYIGFYAGEAAAGNQPELVVVYQ